MAVVTAYTTFDIFDINLNRLVTYLDSWTLYDNQPIDLNGVTYPDTYAVEWYSGSYYTDFSGYDITVDPSTGDITGGVVEAISEGYYSGGWFMSYAVQNIAISAMDLYYAAATPSTSDDYTIIASVLSGADLFRLSAGSDVASGYGGKDILEGGHGDDVLFGGAEKDILKGQADDDMLSGDGGKDKLSGGKGDDIFVFTSRKEAGDKITDFRNRSGDNDAIMIDKASFKGGLGGASKLKASQFQVSKTNQAEEDDIRVIFRSTDKTLWFDQNGDNAGGLTLIADLQGSADVTHHDIFFL